jgi:hypothetical protein
VSKVIFAVWGDDLPTRLRDGALHERLAAAGVRRLQVNVSDGPVASAMRIDHLADPIRGFVSVWDADPAAVAAALADVGTVAGYAVDERRRLDPPETWDGSRAEGLANVAVLRRPDDLDRAEWLRRWMVEHTAVGIRTQATFGYVQNIVVEPVTAGAVQVDGIVEELFPIDAVTDMHAFYGSGGDDAELGRRVKVLMASVGRIGADRNLDLVPTSRYLYDLT